MIDAQGMVLDRFEVGHDRAGLAALVTRRQQCGAPRVIPVAIEAVWRVCANREPYDPAKHAVAKPFPSLVSVEG